VEGECSKTAKF